MDNISGCLWPILAAPLRTSLCNAGFLSEANEQNEYRFVDYR